VVGGHGEDVRRSENSPVRESQAAFQEAARGPRRGSVQEADLVQVESRPLAVIDGRAVARRIVDEPKLEHRRAGEIDAGKIAQGKLKTLIGRRERHGAGLDRLVAETVGKTRSQRLPGGGRIVFHMKGKLVAAREVDADLIGGRELARGYFQKED